MPWQHNTFLTAKRKPAWPAASSQWETDQQMRQFPPPWTIEELDGGFKVLDANGQVRAYIYGHADSYDPGIAKALTLDEARRIASNIAKLPDLLRKVRPDDNIQAVGNLSDERHKAEDTTVCTENFIRID